MRKKVSVFGIITFVYISMRVRRYCMSGDGVRLAGNDGLINGMIKCMMDRLNIQTELAKTNTNELIKNSFD